MESFKKWMDRVVGKRPDITADWSTTNAETLGNYSAVGA